MESSFSPANEEREQGDTTEVYSSCGEISSEASNLQENEKTNRDITKAFPQLEVCVRDLAMSIERQLFLRKMFHSQQKAAFLITAIALLPHIYASS